MIYTMSKKFSITVFLIVAVMLFFNTSCQSQDETAGGIIENRDSIPILKSIGVSTLISDSGVVMYKIISEDWFVYDKKDPPYWSFEKGLFAVWFRYFLFTNEFLS